MEEIKTPLDIAAEKHALYKAPVYAEHHAIEGFKAGAAWKKEQYKLLRELAFQAANVCDNEGAIELCDKIKTELERLQD